MSHIPTNKDASFCLLLVLMVMTQVQSTEGGCTIDCVGSGGTIKGSVCEFEVAEELPIGSTITSLAFSTDPCVNPTLVGSDAATYLEMSGNNIVMKTVVDYDEDPGNYLQPIFVEVECPSGPCTSDRLVIEFKNINDHNIIVPGNTSRAEVWELIPYPSGDPIDLTPKIHATDADVETFLLYSIKDEQTPFRLVDSHGNKPCFPSYGVDFSSNTESPILELSQSQIFNYDYQSSYKLNILVQSFMDDNGCSEGAVETVEYPVIIDVKEVDVPPCSCVCQCCSADPNVQDQYKDQEIQDRDLDEIQTGFKGARQRL